MTNNNGLSPEQSGIFLEVIDASLRIARREHFFTWLQGSCQHLLPHEVLLCGLRVNNEQNFRFENFISTRYVTEQHVETATKQDDGVVSNVIDSWRQSRHPTLLAEGMAPGDYGTHVVPDTERVNTLHDTELRNIAAHGLSAGDGGISTFFCFSRIPGQLNASHAYILQLLVPHLHSALIRVMGAREGAFNETKPQNENSQLTTREREILQWVHLGKTNWEVAGILEISPLTVKNHMQNILRKLNVQNRGHAVAKATKMGLVRT